MKAKDLIALAGVIIAAIALIPPFVQLLSEKTEPVNTVTTKERETVYTIQQSTSSPASRPVASNTKGSSASETIANPRPQNILRSDAIAVLIVNEHNRIDWTLSDQIKSILQRKEYKVSTPSLFTSSFVTKGQFERLFNGDDSGKAQLLQLSQYCKEGFFGKKIVSFTENPDLENVITATVKLEIHIISSITGTIQKSISLTAKGPGFSRDDAEKIAIERVLEDAVGKL